jgi:hypothetical protein
MRFTALLLVTGLAFASVPAQARIVEPRLERASAAQSFQNLDDGSAELAATRKAPPRKKPVRRTPRPDPRRPVAPRQNVNPASIGLGAAGGAAGGALIGAATVGLSALVLTGVFATPTLPVTITAAVVAVGVGLATPFLAAIGGGGAVLLMDPRSQPDEWSGLLKCAGAGYCAGLSLVGGTILGNAGCGGLPCGAPQTPGVDDIPGPDQPAQWTAGSAIAGLVGGTLLGALVGWAVAPSPDDPLVPISIGAMSGAVVGAGVTAGVGAAIATTIRRPTTSPAPAPRR